MRVPSVLGLALVALLAACRPSAPAAPPVAAPTQAPSPPPLPVATLPPVQDATGLPGDGLVLAAAATPPGRLTAGDRTYLLGPARRVAPGQRPGLVLLLPAANTTLREEYDRYSLDDLRDHGLSVAVVGTYGASWNAGGCCGRAFADGVDDVAAVTAVRDAALARTSGDAARVAVVGHSVGALMVWQLVCRPEFRAAAAVAVAGTRTADCPASLPRLPDVLALHGAQDASVPLRGSDRVVPLLGIAPPPVPEVAQQTAQAAACAPPATAGDRVTWNGCAAGGSLRLTVLPGRGHAWEDLDATRRAAAFLREVLPGVR